MHSTYVSSLLSNEHSLECGAKLAKQKEDEARKEKQTAAANAAPVFKCGACAGTGAGDQEYTEQVLRMHFMHAHAPIQRYARVTLVTLVLSGQRRIGRTWFCRIEREPLHV